MKNLLMMAAIGCVLFVGCSKEEAPAPLPALKPVELPKNTAGFYSGRLPCDDCKMRMVRAELLEDSSVTFVQTVVTDTMKTDTLKGTCSVNGVILSISLSEVSMNLKFKRDSLGNMALLTGAGTVYEDADGMTAELIRILRNPKRTAPQQVDSAGEK